MQIISAHSLRSVCVVIVTAFIIILMLLLIATGILLRIGSGGSVEKQVVLLELFVLGVHGSRRGGESYCAA